MRDFKTLQVWEKAHRLTLAVYRVTADCSQLEPDLIEVRRMLNSFIQKLKANR